MSETLCLIVPSAKYFCITLFRFAPFLCTYMYLIQVFLQLCIGLSVSPSGCESLWWGVSHMGSPSPFARFPVSSTVSHKSSMLYLTTSVHLFLSLPRLRCPWTSASRIRLTQSSSLRCICPYHLSLASRTLSVMHATPMMRHMSSFLLCFYSFYTVMY